MDVIYKGAILVDYYLDGDCSFEWHGNHRFKQFQRNRMAFDILNPNPYFYSIDPDKFDNSIENQDVLIKEFDIPKSVFKSVIGYNYCRFTNDKEVTKYILGKLYDGLSDAELVLKCGKERKLVEAYLKLTST